MKVTLGIYFFFPAQQLESAEQLTFLFMSCVFPWRHYNTSGANMENTQSSPADVVQSAQISERPRRNNEVRIYKMLSVDAAAPHTVIRDTYRRRDLCRL